jgi:hypothetical protein
MYQGDRRNQGMSLNLTTQKKQHSFDFLSIILFGFDAWELLLKQNGYPSSDLHDTAILLGDEYI